ncbi:MAG: thiolase family protein [Oscillospiraceae bacterium]|nr:thiolase family protein [Oscillospiraceae bacterium]
MKNAVLVSAVRTPVGKRGGVFKTIQRMDLLKPCILEALKRANLEGRETEVDDVLLGNNPEARTPARYGWLASGLPVEVAGLTINRACGTGLTGITLAGTFIKGGYGEVYMCGGVEFDSKPVYLVNSSNPYAGGGISIVKKLSSPQEFGNPSMVQTAENVAAKFGISREDCDAYAARSQALALQGYEEGIYPEHIIPITIPQKKADPIIIDRDEILRPGTTPEILAKLKPVADGVVTGGNASPLNDGAAACIMMEEEKARSLGLKPLMRFVDYATTGVDPRYMGMGPVNAMRKLMARNGMTVNDFDFIEVNEAFAAQTLAVQRELEIPMEKLNIRGGAIALGHPYSATGVNLAAKAAGIFARNDFERCAISFCCGGGQGVAAIFEKC